MRAVRQVVGDGRDLLHFEVLSGSTNSNRHFGFLVRSSSGSFSWSPLRRIRTLGSRGDELASKVWPEYNLHGDVLSQYWGFLDEVFPEFQFVAYDPDSDSVLAQGHSLPCSWDATIEGLPEGIDAVVEEAFLLHHQGGRPNTLSALAIEIHLEHQRKGLSRLLVESMRGIAAGQGFSNLIAPVRPNGRSAIPSPPSRTTFAGAGRMVSPSIPGSESTTAWVASCCASSPGRSRSRGPLGVAGVDPDGLPGDRAVCHLTWAGAPHVTGISW